MAGSYTKCPKCLDPNTIGQNLLGLSYPGGNNPKTFNKKYSYSYTPSNLAEYPAIGHDRRYDNIETVGLKGLLTDTRVIGADLLYVIENYEIAFNRNLDPVTRSYGFILGTGLGIMAMPKTYYQLSKPNGFEDIFKWFFISNVGVTNTPSIHKH